MKICFIHGANATDRSFNFIRLKCGIQDQNSFCLNYDSENGFLHNIKQMEDVVRLIDDQVFIIAHSLGGIYAAHLASNFKKIVGAITLSTPYKGAEIVDYIRWALPGHQLFNDISSTSWPFMKLNEINLFNLDWTQVVSTQGHVPYLPYPNDGVVSLASMRGRDDINLIEMPVNHYEVVVSHQVANLIENKLGTLQ